MVAHIKRSPAVAWEDALQFIAVLTFKVSQGRLFSSHLKGRVQFSISDQ